MNGIQLIQKERNEQISKHGYTIDHDRRVNPNKDLWQAAAHICLLAGILKEPLSEGKSDWPAHWSLQVLDNIKKKTKLQQIVVAGALSLAEFERTGVFFCMNQVQNCAETIDNLLTEERNNLQRVFSIQDDDGHNYLIPMDLRNDFHDLLDIAARDDNYDEFNHKFSKYRTGGGPNAIQLWAELPE